MRKRSYQDHLEEMVLSNDIEVNVTFADGTLTAKLGKKFQRSCQKSIVNSG